MRDLAYKKTCTVAEKKILSDYINALRNIVGDSLYRFYRELAPGFFEWSEHELDQYKI